jgi:hypothetical protein
MPTPQFNVRVPERYHALLRLIVERLRANPEGADALADALLAVCRQPADALLAVCRQPAGKGADNLLTAAGKGADNLPTAADTEVLRSILERLDALEEREPRMVRIEALETRVATLEETMAGTQATPLRTAPAGEPLVTGGGGTRRRLTPAGIVEVERMIRAGISDAEIAGRVGMDRGAIRQRRLKLETSSPPLTLDQTRQVDAMLQAGRSAEEIMKVTGRPIPSREEIKQRLADEIAPPSSTD